MKILRILFNRIFRRKQIDMVLKEAHFKDGSMEIVAKHPKVAIIAQELGKYFIAQGAINYCEMGLFDPDTIGVFYITIRKAQGMAPSQVADIYRTALKEIIDNPQHAAHIAHKAISLVGFKPEDNRNGISE